MATNAERSASVPRYRPTGRIRLPKGLGLVEDFKYLRTQTDRPVKATCPGPINADTRIAASSDRAP